MTSAPPNPALHWDIFCRVIDNFGDMGVCWRLAAHLAQRGQRVRLWTDDASALGWMAPDGAQGVQVLPWGQPLNLTGVTPGDVLVEAFGCEVAPEYVAAYARHIRARGQKGIWINLEYLSAEAYVRRCHGLPSPVTSGPGRGLTKHFFYPGFTPGTGGLLREPDLPARQLRFERHHWLAQAGSALPDNGGPFGIPHALPERSGQRLVSLFCYEPVGLPALLDALAGDARPTLLLVTPGRATAAVKQLVLSKNTLQPNWNQRKQLLFLYLEARTQAQFDELLWACDLNFVRGEDSLVRALWAGQALVWQPYPQDDGAHAAKLDAFLHWLQAPPALRQLHHDWCGLSDASGAALIDHALQPDTLAQWRHTVQQARQTLLTQNDLASALLEFALKTH